MPSSIPIVVLLATLALAACPSPPESGDARDSSDFEDRDSDVIPPLETDAQIASQDEVDGASLGPCDADEDCRGSDPCIVAACIDSACVLTPRVCPDDGNPCTDAWCKPDEGCLDVPNIAPCDDDSACTLNDRCNGGACVGQPASCDDDEACTDDGCDPASGCTFIPRVGSCDDGNACTIDDVCAAGRCGGIERACPVPPGRFGCAAAVCDTRTGCAVEEVAGGCDDGNACTQGEACSEGRCVGALVGCDDLDPCTDDYCDPSAGCVTTANRAPCEDGDACTVGDRCDAEACVPGPRSETCCACVDDENACTIDLCTDSGCQAAPSPVVPSALDGDLMVEDFETELEPARWTLTSDNAEVVWQRDASWHASGQWSLYVGQVPAYSYDFGATRAVATWRGPVPRDADALVVFVRSHVAEASCSYDALVVTLDGVPLRPVCGPNDEGADVRWDIGVKAGRVVDIGFVFDTVDGDDNDGTGIWLDAMRFARSGDAQCCETAADCPTPVGCGTALCDDHRCGLSTVGCP